MAIEFHCNFCGKQVKAPDDAGGKRGKCPSCQKVLYIPMPEGAVDEFDLAPVDEYEERKRLQMEEQARATERALLREKQAPGEGAMPKDSDIEIPPPPPPPPVDTSPSSISEEDIEFLIVEWLRSMADGDLGDADRSMMQLRKGGALARQVAAKLAIAEPPPSGLKEVPRPVLNRYFKMLKEQL